MSLDATVGGANANSFLTVAEAQAYWDTRKPSASWDNAEDQEAALIMATRTIVAVLSPFREFVPSADGKNGYFKIYPTWTGSVASTTQALPWPRNDMLDRNGNAIPNNVIPNDLKYATAELAGQMSASDRLVDNDVAVQGIRSIKAGSVALTFAENIMTTKILPNYVMMLLVPSWLTDMDIEQMFGDAEFDVVS